MAEETITILKVGTDEAIRNIGDLRNNIRILKEQLSGLEIGTEQYQKTLQTLITNQNALRGAMNATTASMTDVAKAAAGVTKETKKEDGQVQQLATTYNGLVNQLANLKRELRNVDISTTEGMETYKTMAVQVNAVNDKLKEMDALQGNYQRNVGNYTSALNGLNVATAQIVRELPAATVSANTFFLAISNNIPALVDQIANLRAQNEAAIAQGGKAVSILGALGKSLLSWNTLITVGVTLLTLFGGKLIDMIANLFKSKDAALDAADAIKQLRESVDFSSISDQVANVERLSQVFSGLGDDAEAKKKFIEDYRKELDETGVAVENIADAENLLITNKDAYIAALRERQIALSGMDLAAAEYEKGIKAVSDNSKHLADIEQTLEDWQAKIDEANAKGDEDMKTWAENQRNQVLMSRARILAEIDGYMEAGDSFISAANDFFKRRDDIYKNAGFRPIEDDESGSGSGTKDNTLDYIRQMQDAQLALLSDGYEKQLAERKLYYERQIEDLKATLETEENLTEEGRAAINETIRALTLQGEQESARIMAEWEQSKRDIWQETLDALGKDAETFGRQLDKEEKANERRRERELEQTRKWTEQMNEAKLQRVDEEAGKALSTNENAIGINEGERAEREYQIIQEANQKKLELLRQFEQDALDAKNPQLAIQYQQQAADMEVEIEENAAARKKKVWEDEKNAKMATLMGVANGTASILDSMADMYEADAENSEKSAQQAKNLRIASATIETITGAIGAFMQASASYTPPYGQILGAVQAAVVLATGMAQIAKIKNTDVNKDKSPSGSVGGISATVSAPTITPQVTQVRNVTSASEEDRLNRMADDQRVYILSSDLEANQNQRRVRIRETSF